MSNNEAPNNPEGNVAKEALGDEAKTAETEKPEGLPTPEKIIIVPPNPPANNNASNINANLQGALPPLFSPDQLSNLNATLQDTMQNFALNMDSGFQDNINYEDFSNFFTSMTDQSDAIIPILQEIVQNALTRQILYRPFKALLDKYTPWIDVNQTLISNQDLERYSEQKLVLQELCEELAVDDMGVDNDENNRIEKTNRIMSLLYRMQDLGAPPEEVTRDLMPRIQFDEQGQPVIPEGINLTNLENLCNIM